MQRAFEMAVQGEGSVEPNPMVGAVLLNQQGAIVAEGFHRRFGGPHAEIIAIEKAGTKAKEGTLFVTLEPCCHSGKTGPCTVAIVRAGIRKVVVATLDPSEKMRGLGIQELKKAGIETEIGILEAEANALIAPFRKLFVEKRPWIHLKWAMSLDGKIATHSGDSRWISNEKSRQVVHRLRGRMDAIIIGAKTARLDDPLLTARPSGPRVPTRIVIDPSASLDLDSQLVRTVKQAPLTVVVSESADPQKTHKLKNAGAEIFGCSLNRDGESNCLELEELFSELGKREMTNVLVEGGATLAGYLWDGKLVDEVHAFISPKLIGGRHAISAISGVGISLASEAILLKDSKIEIHDGDVYVSGRIHREKNPLK